MKLNLLILKLILILTIHWCHWSCAQDLESQYCFWPITSCWVGGKNAGSDEEERLKLRNMRWETRERPAQKLIAGSDEAMGEADSVYVDLCLSVETCNCRNVSTNTPWKTRKRCWLHTTLCRLGCIVVNTTLSPRFEGYVRSKLMEALWVGTKFHCMSWQWKQYRPLQRAGWAAGYNRVLEDHTNTGHRSYTTRSTYTRSFSPAPLQIHNRIATTMTKPHQLHKMAILLNIISSLYL